MATFGFSLGDILLVSNYAYTVYKSCKNAGEAFKSITSDVNSLRSLLLVLNDECVNPHSSFQRLPPLQKAELTARLQDCKAVLREVKKALHNYRSLNTNDPQTRDRLAFTNGTQSALREKMEIQATRIQQFLSGLNVGTLSRIENNTEIQLLSAGEIRAKLDDIHRDLLAGRRDVSALEDAEGIVALEEELVGDNMTEVDVDISLEVSRWLDRVRQDVNSEVGQDLVSEQDADFELGSDGTSEHWAWFEQGRSKYGFEGAPSSRTWTEYQEKGSLPVLVRNPPPLQPLSSDNSPPRPGMRRISTSPPPPPPPPPSQLSLLPPPPPARYFNGHLVDAVVDVSLELPVKGHPMRHLYMQNERTRMWTTKKTFLWNKFECFAVHIQVHVYQWQFRSEWAKRIIVKRCIQESGKPARFEENLITIRWKPKETNFLAPVRLLYQGLGNQIIQRSAWRDKVIADDVLLQVIPW